MVLIMRVLICPDSFKECLSAKRVAEHIAIGIRRVIPRAEIHIIPLADGGEGTVASMVDATGGKLKRVKVNDPLMRSVDSFYGILGDKKTALIEMAAASGLELLNSRDRNPWITSTFGTGELIKYAMDEGCKKIIVGIGGSATNDGGMGAAMALGIKFLDKHGNELAPGGGSLGDLESIDNSGIDIRIRETGIYVACDVTNPLTGKNGASYIFGPQKGADADMVERLDRNLCHFAIQIKRYLGRDIEHVPGSGAAGGLGAGLIAFTNAEIRPGFELVAEITDLNKWIGWSDIVITGEGKIDFQTKFGKTPFGVAGAAGKLYKPVIAIAGTLGQGYEVLYENGIHCMVPITDKPMDLESAMKNAGMLIESAAERVFRLLQLGNTLTQIAQ
jgi:glycerate kinase